jgi:hypothetical protein
MMMFNSNHESIQLRALIAAIAIATTAFVAGCDNLECGEGTAEVDGECTAADGVSPETDSCGEGTSYSPTEMACVPDTPPTECGPNTVPQVRQDGVVVCVGTGMDDCTSPIFCADPDSNNISVCGRLVDAETGLRIEQAGAPTDCDPLTPSASGPCSLELELYDAIEFANNPAAAPPLDRSGGEVTIDSCGRFRALNLAAPTFGAVGISVDDAGATDTYALTGSAALVSPGMRIEGLSVRATSRQTDDGWTSSAGDPFSGQTFSEVGVVLAVFSTSTTPTSGVTITFDGATRVADDYYFSDTDQRISTVDTALTATGANGAGLMVNAGQGDYGGQGAEPQGCVWPARLASTAGDVVFVANRPAVDMQSGAPCP